MSRNEDGLASPSSLDDELRHNFSISNSPVMSNGFSTDLKSNDTRAEMKTNDSMAKRSTFRRTFTPRLDVIAKNLESFSTENDVSLQYAIFIYETSLSSLMGQVDFRDLLEQLNVGVEMMTHLKEVVRKFGKYQEQGSAKLLSVLEKYAPIFEHKKVDGIKEFAQCCDLAYQLVMETARAQCRLAEFLSTKVVPTMNGYIEVFHIPFFFKKKKKESLNTCIKDITYTTSNKKFNKSIGKANKHKLNWMPQSRQWKNKELRGNTQKQMKEDIAKSASEKAKQVGPVQRLSRHKSVEVRDWNKPRRSWISKVGKKLSNSSEEEQLYLKALQEDKVYQATVMTANYQQDIYNQTEEKFKKECHQMEVDRITFCVEQLKTFITQHRQMFHNEKILVCLICKIPQIHVLFCFLEKQNRVVLIPLFSFISHRIALKGPKRKPSYFQHESGDFQNSFYSLRDAMDSTKKIDVSATVPKIMTILCEKVLELEGHKTEGIFRISPAAIHLQTLRRELMNNDYSVKTRDVHVPACMLKEWLRGLNDSLIPSSYYDACVTMVKEKKKLDHETLDVFLSQLPQENRESIRYLVGFLKKLLDPKCIELTKMNLENIGIVFAPTILHCPSDDPTLLMQNNKFERDFAMQLITNLIID
ncbi:hypothetical protein RFI_00894 [Reticulomyxa filosa]|uniref:Rho-GAP domain-containing protein n=1 Tax=Reticulomyxa filosa TaxID=46433 RepID=X6PEQ4_RETFI|nr:hypothetical protein RFI_00894 [Reticulomyxa filosa]|eukprot:ETO36167.1 hypothetical protein RFI_00894 [Reticulomyxa filosa]